MFYLGFNFPTCHELDFVIVWDGSITVIFADTAIILQCSHVNELPVRTWEICKERAGKLRRLVLDCIEAECLRPNTVWKALDEIYKMHSVAKLLKIFLNENITDVC